MDSPLTGKSVAPWSEEEVINLNDFQTSNYMHPFTCRCGKDLLATKAGWRCDCGYSQDWAHKFMSDGSWRAAAADIHSLLNRAN